MALILPKACHLESQWNTPTKWCGVCQPDCIPTPQPNDVVSVNRTASPNKWCLSIRLSPHTPTKYCQQTTFLPPSKCCLSNKLSPHIPTKCYQPDYLPHPNQMVPVKQTISPPQTKCYQPNCFPTPQHNTVN